MFFWFFFIPLVLFCLYVLHLQEVFTQAQVTIVCSLARFSEMSQDDLHKEIKKEGLQLPWITFLIIMEVLEEKGYVEKREEKTNKRTLKTPTFYKLIRGGTRKKSGFLSKLLIKDIKGVVPA